MTACSKPYKRERCKVYQSDGSYVGIFTVEFGAELTELKDEGLTFTSDRAGFCGRKQDLTISLINLLEDSYTPGLYWYLIRETDNRAYSFHHPIHIDNDGEKITFAASLHNYGVFTPA